jgi:O-succinylbenzoic acid--CoA ligase
VKVQAWLERAAQRRPDHPAINAMTYAELFERARAVASALAPGERVAIGGLTGEEFAVALHGCLLAGAVADPGAQERGQAPVLQPGGAVQERGQAPCFHDLDRPAIVVRTSGTTSEPKEVELSYGNWLWSALGSAAALGHPPDERWLCALPLTHVGGLSILVRSVIAATTVLLHERWSTDAVLLGTDDATMISLVPTTLKRLLDAGLEDPPALRHALLGGAPIPPALMEQAQRQGVPVAPTYGLTEACSQVTTNGVPLFCTRVSLEPDGEIVVDGPTVAGGGPLHTGDLGRWCPDGTLAITGRKADTIITGGENVAPAQVEAALESHPAVQEAAVVGRPDAEWGEAVTALVVLEPGASATAEDLRAYAAARVDRAAVPKAIEVRSDPLPRTASGKLLRRELR